jgi:hypothetical protein
MRKFARPSYTWIEKYSQAERPSFVCYEMPSRKWKRKFLLRLTVGRVALEPFSGLSSGVGSISG